ncbi:conserved Plasmodium protein, unknown function [Plasmodium relictum]|uniref:Vacuolar protein 14 C-terminal Fig4-binding domain-containing protein n=1 Tax=Plasmodium relictum TaxID=85471 RepID=A0A1J1HBK2_PLARL|nr:conserved Plasmodium protein, unknown function [Plasmodium relictum]CRH02679.1 conserved Plasmodium protein, unknown function [Plasmodium relictum]
MFLNIIKGLERNEDKENVINANIQKLLGDKTYEKRKKGAQELAELINIILEKEEEEERKHLSDLLDKQTNETLNESKNFSEKEIDKISKENSKNDLEFNGENYFRSYNENLKKEDLYFNKDEDKKKNYENQEEKQNNKKDIKDNGKSKENIFEENKADLDEEIRKFCETDQTIEKDKKKITEIEKEDYYKETNEENYVLGSEIIKKLLLDKCKENYDTNSDFIKSCESKHTKKKMNLEMNIDKSKRKLNDILNDNDIYIENLNKKYQNKKILNIINFIDKKFIQSVNISERCGGLISLAFISISLDVKIKFYFTDILKIIISCINDPDSKVRYYVCESLYNLCKVSKNIIFYKIEDIFDCLYRIFSDSCTNVKNGGAYLDNLLKDMTCSYNNIFNIYKIIYVLKDKISIENADVRQLIISWLYFLQNIPTINIFEYFHFFIKDLFLMLSDENKDIQKQANQCLDLYIDKITTSNYEQCRIFLKHIAQVILKFCDHKNTIIKHRSLLWIYHFISILNIHFYNIFKSSKKNNSFIIELLKKIIYCTSDVNFDIHYTAKKCNELLINYLKFSSLEAVPSITKLVCDIINTKIEKSELILSTKEVTNYKNYQQTCHSKKKKSQNFLNEETDLDKNHIINNEDVHNINRDKTHTNEESKIFYSIYQYNDHYIPNEINEKEKNIDKDSIKNENNRYEKDGVFFNSNDIDKYNRKNNIVGNSNLNSLGSNSYSSNRCNVNKNEKYLENHSLHFINDNNIGKDVYEMNNNEKNKNNDYDSASNYNYNNNNNENNNNGNNNEYNNENNRKNNNTKISNNNKKSTIDDYINSDYKCSDSISSRNNDYDNKNNISESLGFESCNLFYKKNNTSEDVKNKILNNYDSKEQNLNLRFLRNHEKLINEIKEKKILLRDVSKSEAYFINKFIKKKDNDDDDDDNMFFDNFEKRNIYPVIMCLQWLIEILIYKSNEIKTYYDHIVVCIFKCLKNDDSKVLLLSLTVLSAMCSTVNNKFNFYEKISENLIILFKSDENLLIHKGKVIVQHISRCLNNKKFYAYLSYLLINENNLKFVNKFVQVLNWVLLTSIETKYLRNVLFLKKYYNLFSLILIAWFHNPLSAISFLLWLQKYELAYFLCSYLTLIDVDSDFFHQLDNFIFLFESPVFSKQRIHLIYPKNYPFLIKSLMILSLMLPLNTSNNILQKRLQISQLSILTSSEKVTHFVDTHNHSEIFNIEDKECTEDNPENKKYENNYICKNEKTYESAELFKLENEENAKEYSILEKTNLEKMNEEEQWDNKYNYLLNNVKKKFLKEVLHNKKTFGKYDESNEFVNIFKTILKSHNIINYCT